jgi:hypothetical protein
MWLVDRRWGAPRRRPHRQHALRGGVTARGEGTSVPIAQAKGRPMLSWVGKRPLREVRAFPAQLVERFAPRPSGQRR